MIGYLKFIIFRKKKPKNSFKLKKLSLRCLESLRLSYKERE